MRTNWKIVALNETHFWRDDIVAKAGSLYGIYLFDANSRVYCCEITPSYELEFIETVHTAGYDDEALHEAVMEGDLVDRASVSYHHCGPLNRLDPKWFCDFPKHNTEYTTDEEWEEGRDEMMEYLRGNQYVPSGVTFTLEQE